MNIGKAVLGMFFALCFQPAFKHIVGKNRLARFGERFLPILFVGGILFAFKVSQLFHEGEDIRSHRLRIRRTLELMEIKLHNVAQKDLDRKSVHCKVVKLHEDSVIALGKLHELYCMNFAKEHRNLLVGKFKQLLVRFFKRHIAVIPGFNLHFAFRRNILKHLVLLVRHKAQAHCVAACNSLLNRLFHEVKVHFSLPVIAGADVVDGIVRAVLQRHEKHELLRNGKRKSVNLFARRQCSFKHDVSSLFLRH